MVLEWVNTLNWIALLSLIIKGSNNAMVVCIGSSLCLNLACFDYSALVDNSSAKDFYAES